MDIGIPNSKHSHQIHETKQQQFNKKITMTKNQYFQFATKFFGDCVEISRRKNGDYTGNAPDPFSNFRSVEVLGIKAEVGFLTRMMDKMRRISSFVEHDGKLRVNEEAIRDTLIDLANYACLLAGYIHSNSEDSEDYKQVMPRNPLSKGVMRGDISVFGEVLTPPDSL